MQTVSTLSDAGNGSCVPCAERRSGQKPHGQPGHVAIRAAGRRAHRAGAIDISERIVRAIDFRCFSANTNGNLIIVFVRLSTTSQTVTVSDTGGNH